MKKNRSLVSAIEFYLETRRQLGFGLRQEGRVLAGLGRFAQQRHHRGPLTSELVLHWAQLPQTADRLWWARRLEMARRFALFWVAHDPRTEIPPPGVFGPAYRRRAVHIYSAEQINLLLSAAISPHTFRHTTAMHQLQAGVDITVIALWLGHEDPVTTHQYIELDLRSKEKILHQLKAPTGKIKRFKPTDQVLKFLENL